MYGFTVLVPPKRRCVAVRSAASPMAPPLSLVHGVWWVALKAMKV